MSNLLDDLFSGAVSRRNFIEMAAKAGLALPMANFTLAEIAAQSLPKTPEGKKQNKVEWAEGSLFSIPMNLVHRHFNSDSAHPARLLVISTFPYALQSFGSVGLLSNMQYDFNDRFDASPDFFKRDERIRQRWEQANFVKDVRSAEVVAWQERGDGNASMYWDMAGNTILEPHISEFEVGSYKLGHRHP